MLRDSKGRDFFKESITSHHLILCRQSCTRSYLSFWFKSQKLKIFTIILKSQNLDISMSDFIQNLLNRKLFRASQIEDLNESQGSLSSIRKWATFSDHLNRQFWKPRNHLVKMILDNFLSPTRTISDRITNPLIFKSAFLQRLNCRAKFTELQSCKNE